VLRRGWPLLSGSAAEVIPLEKKAPEIAAA
jgi:hypothetical protein